MDNKIKEELNKIDIPKELDNRVKLGMENANRDMNKKHMDNKDTDKIHMNKKYPHLKKKWGFKRSLLIGAAVLLLGISFSMSNNSSALAKVVSNIPYLNSIIQSKPVIVLISDELDKKGFRVYGIDTIYKPEKKVRIRLADDEGYNDKVIKEVKKIAEGTLKSKGYDAYSIDVSILVREEEYIPTKEEKKEKEVLEKDLLNKFEEKNYKVADLLVNPVNKKINVNIEQSKQYYEEIRDKVETTALEIVKSHNYTGYKIEINNIHVIIRPSGKSAQIEPSLSEALLSKTEYKVTGISFTDNPLKFYIKTSIMSTDPIAKKHGGKLDVVINEFFQTSEIKNVLDNDPYEVVIYSKDKKRIN